RAARRHSRRSGPGRSHATQSRSGGIPELVHDETGEPTAVCFGVRRHERREARVHDAVDDARRRRAGDVDGRHAVARSGRRANERLVPAFRTCAVTERNHPLRETAYMGLRKRAPLAMCDLGGSPSPLAQATTALTALTDRANALQARLIAVRRLL